MRPRLTLASCLLAAVVAWATSTWGVGGEGVFSGTSCSTLTTPATGKSWCGDPTDRLWKVWTGATWSAAVAGATGSIGATGPTGATGPAGAAGVCTGISGSFAIGTACTFTYSNGCLTAATGVCP